MLRMFLAVILALATGLPAAAQSTAINGTIEGTVTDESGGRAARRHRHGDECRHR